MESVCKPIINTPKPKPKEEQPPPVPETSDNKEQTDNAESNVDEATKEGANEPAAEVKNDMDLD